MLYSKQDKSSYLSDSSIIYIDLISEFHKFKVGHQCLFNRGVSRESSVTDCAIDCGKTPNVVWFTYDSEDGKCKCTEEGDCQKQIRERPTSIIYRFEK